MQEQLDRIERKLNVLLYKEHQMGKALDDLTAAVQREKTVSQSVVTMLDDIATRLKTAVENDDSAALDALAAELTGNSDAIAAAVLRNTPAAKVEPPSVPTDVPPADPGSTPQP